MPEDKDMTRMIGALNGFLAEFADIMDPARTGRPRARPDRRRSNGAGADICIARMAHMNKAHGLRS